VKVVGVFEDCSTRWIGCAVERVVSVGVVGEGSTVVCGRRGGFECVLVGGAEFVEAMPGGRWLVGRVGEVVVCGVDVVVASCDGSVVASGHRRWCVVRVRLVAPLRPVGRMPVAGVARRFVAGGAVVVAAVGRNRRVERVSWSWRCSRASVRVDP